jgi:hypothetical protein
MLATDLMRQVSYLSDNTIEQTRQSAQAYRDARDHLAPYKRLLDVYTSRWFNNSRYVSKKADSVRLFLKDSQTKTWLRDPQTALADTLFRATDIAGNALRAAEEKRFFHWEMEFPEVFFAPSRPGGQDVQLSPNGGFDAVVSNPSYISVVNIEEDERPYYLEVFDTAVGRFDLYIVFVECSLKLLNQNGSMSFIMPMKFSIYANGKSLRKLILNEYELVKLLDISQCIDVFEEPSTYPCIAII